MSLKTISKPCLHCGGYKRQVSNGKCPCRAKYHNDLRGDRRAENFTRNLKSNKAIERLFSDIRRSGSVGAVKDIKAIESYLSHRAYCNAACGFNVNDDGSPSVQSTASVQHIAPLATSVCHGEEVVGLISSDNMAIMPINDNRAQNHKSWDRESGEYTLKSKLSSELALPESITNKQIVDLLEQHLGDGIFSMLCKKRTDDASEDVEDSDTPPEDYYDESETPQTVEELVRGPYVKEPATKLDIYKHEAFNMTLGWLYDAYNHGDENRFKQKELVKRRAERKRREYILYHQSFDELSPNDKRRRQWVIWSHKYRMWGCAIEPHFMVKWNRKPTEDESKTIKQYLYSLERKAAKLTSTWKLEHALETSDSLLPDPVWIKGKFQRMPEFTKVEEVDPSDPNYLDSIFGS